MRLPIYSYLIFFLFTSCAGLFHERSFLSEMDRTPGWWEPGQDFPVVPGDKGRGFRSKKEIMARTPASKKEKARMNHKVSLEDELKQKEDKLSDKEFRKYRENEDYLEGTSEKLYYLNLPPNQRLEYLSLRRGGIRTRLDRGSDYNFWEERAIKRGDLYLGMDKDAVMQSWGRPQKIEVAGDPRNQNERWSFYGRGGLKVVYFERGIVQGWGLE